MDVYKTECIRNVVLLGHGGAGKTTFMRLVLGLALPANGVIEEYLDICED